MSTTPIGKNDIINQANHPGEVVGSFNGRIEYETSLLSLPRFYSWTGGS